MPASHRQLLVSGHTDPGVANIMKTTAAVMGRVRSTCLHGEEKTEERQAKQKQLIDPLNTSLPLGPFSSRP